MEIHGVNALTLVGDLCCVGFIRLIGLLMVINAKLVLKFHVALCASHAALPMVISKIFA
jgi:hypothetical protein